MKLIVPIIGLFAIFAVASTDGKDDIKVVDLAEDLAKAREEIKEIIQRENEKLNAEDVKLREEDEKIKKDANKIKKENQRLRKQMAKLRRDNSEIKKIQRQKDQNNTLELQHFLKDQNNTLELQHFLKDSIRQRDVSSELKKLMKRQIDEYLQVNKICVAGNYSKSVGPGPLVEPYHTVDFGHTFPRVPAFTASISAFSINSVSNNRYLHAPDSVKKVTNSSAALYLYVDSNFAHFSVAWMACL